ncbi:MAG: SDR family oxidoreductase [Aestuariivirga sp.]
MGERLKGKKCLVYGGGTGIGLACAEAIAGEGADVFISGRREGVLQSAAAQLMKYGNAGYAAGDATSVADVKRITASAADFMGGLDTVVISAGAGGKTSMFDAEPEEFQRIIDCNMRPLFLAVRYAIPHLVEAKAASVIAISSMYGLVGQRERVAYCGAKAGVNGMVMSMALDLADKGVRVNSICPGFVETPLAREVVKVEADPEAALNAKRLMHPIQRAGTLAEMGELAVYLASDLSAFMTGQAIAIDGGYTTR